MNLKIIYAPHARKIASIILFGISLFLIAAPVKAQVPVGLGPDPIATFLSTTGAPLAGGKIFTYAAGTNTPLATYTDSTGLVQNANPVILNSAGQASIWFTSAAYKITVQNAAGVPQYTTDNFLISSLLSSNNAFLGNNTFAGTSTFNGAVTMNAGGALSGTFTGNPSFSGSPNFSTGTPVFSTKLIPNLNASSQSMSIANAAVTGTVLNSLAKLTGAPATAVLPLLADTVGAIGIVTAGAGTTSNATVQNVGVASCNFDGATVAGDYVIFSPSVAGDCHDVGGGGYPSSGQVLGRVLSTNAALGAYQMILFGSEDRGANAVATFPSVVYSTASASTNANIVTTPMITAPSNATYRLTIFYSESVVGVSCVGTTTVTPTFIFTDPLAAGSTTTNFTSLSLWVTGNGTVGPAYSFGGSVLTSTATTFEFRAKSGTTISYSIAYSIGGSCSPGPQYIFYPVLEQLSSN